MLDPQVVVNLLPQLGYGVRHSHNNSLTMSDRLTFICVLEANLALSCVPSAGHWPLLLFILKWTVRRSSFLGKSGWTWGCVSAVDSSGRTIWIADAHRRDGKRHIVHADEPLTAFLELEPAIRAVEPLAAVPD